MANCNFTALPQEDVMAVGNASIKFNVKNSLPAEDRNRVEIVAWNGKDGIIEYNDRLRITETFLDLVPYVPLIKDWMRAAEEDLSLNQAKLIMRDFIDALYISKRQLPYGGYTAKDDDIFYNTARLVAGGSSGIVPEINARIDAINSTYDAINNRIATINSRISETNSRFDYTCIWLNLRPQANTFRSGQVGQATTQGNGIIDPGSGFVGTWSGTPTGANALITWSVEAYAPGIGWAGVGRNHWPQYDAVSLGHMGADVAYITPPYLTHISGGTGDTVPWETEAGQINTLSYNDANALLRNILNRSRDLLTIKAAKINAMLALTTLPTVIDFDLTGGW